MPPPKLFFSPKDGRYRKANGQLVSAAQVRAELDRSLLKTAQRTKMLGDDLRAGRMSLEAWRFEMRAAIKDANLRGAALAKGGWERMTQEDFGRVGQLIREEYKALEQWVEEIKTGLPLDGRLRTRGQLYVQAGRATYHKVQEVEMARRGMEQERSVLHPADHCDECVAEADVGWRPVGEMIPIGSRTCGRNCRCTVEYKRAA